MKKILSVLIPIILLSNNAFALTLYEALNETYKNNTQLNAERENIKASEEDINISQADYMPSLSLTGSKSFENTNLNSILKSLTANAILPILLEKKLVKKMLSQKWGRILNCSSIGVKFGGGRGSGTNDKAGSILNLLRWVSPRTIKETFVPPTDYRYPFLG